MTFFFLFSLSFSFVLSSFLMGLGLWLFVGLREMETLDLDLVWFRFVEAVTCSWVCRFKGDGSVRDGENREDDAFNLTRPNKPDQPACAYPIRHTRRVCCFYCSLRVEIV